MLRASLTAREAERGALSPLLAARWRPDPAPPALGGYGPRYDPRSARDVVVHEELLEAVDEIGQGMRRSDGRGLGRVLPLARARRSCARGR